MNQWVENSLFGNSVSLDCFFIRGVADNSWQLPIMNLLEADSEFLGAKQSMTSAYIKKNPTQLLLTGMTVA